MKHIAVHIDVDEKTTVRDIEKWFRQLMSIWAGPATIVKVYEFDTNERQRTNPKAN